MKYWNRLVCYFHGHRFDLDTYVQGSWKLECKRCDNVVRM